MNKDETLVILTPGFPENEADTTCLPMQQSLIRCIKKTYPQQNIIVLSFQYPYFKKTYKWFDTTVISFDGRNKGGLPRLLLRKKLYTTLKEINRANKIVGLLSFWYGECALVGKRFADKYGIKHFCWILGQDARKENKYPGQVALKAHELIALSDFIQDEFEKNHDTKPQFVIPPGIDPALFDDNPGEKDIDILAAGSLIPLKQYDIFIEVVAEIKKQLPAVKAMLIGDGPEKEKLQKLISNAGLQSTITLSGELPHAEVLQWMQRTKLFLHPSSYEGFGVVCLEAIYSKVSVISFVKPMNRDIKNWYISNNKEEMREKTLEILQDLNIDYSPVLPFLMSDCARAIEKLFGFGK